MQGKKTLCLDLDETVVHSELTNEYSPNYQFDMSVDIQGDAYQFFVNVRKGAREFIVEMSKYYEIIIFTASLKQYSDQIINYLDPQKKVAYRLSREHCIKLENGMGFIKDLSKLGRDLKNCIIIDNTPQCFSLQPENGIQIINFYDDMYDNELACMQPFLKFMSLVDDIRPIQEYINKYLNQNIIEYTDIKQIKRKYDKIKQKDLEDDQCHISIDQSHIKQNNLQKSVNFDTTSNKLEQSNKLEISNKIQFSNKQELSNRLQLSNSNNNSETKNQVLKINIKRENSIHKEIIIQLNDSNENHKTLVQEQKNIEQSAIDCNKSQTKSERSSTSNLREIDFLEDKRSNGQNTSRCYNNLPMPDQNFTGMIQEQNDFNSENRILDNFNFLCTKDLLVPLPDRGTTQFKTIFDCIPIDKSEGHEDINCQGQSQYLDQSEINVKSTTIKQINQIFSQQQQERNLKINNNDIPKYRSFILGDSIISLGDKQHDNDRISIKSQVVQSTHPQKQERKQSFISFSTETNK